MKDRTADLVESFMAQVTARHDGEPEFLQAVEEVARDVLTIDKASAEFTRARVLETALRGRPRLTRAWMRHARNWGVALTGKPLSLGGQPGAGAGHRLRADPFHPSDAARARRGNGKPARRHLRARQCRAFRGP